MAFLAANTGVAYSPAMRITLGIFVNACQKTNTRCWLVHVGKKANLIADFSSLFETEKADEEVRSAG